MFRIVTRLYVNPTSAARDALGVSVRDASRAAYAALAASGVGLEVEHLPFEFHGTRLALCARLRRDGAVLIEVDLAPPGLSPRVLPSRHGAQRAGRC